jgi:cytochrome c biogenesis protein
MIISVISDHQQTPAQTRYYTGLVVAYDPGVGLVYTGFILMIVGCWIAFFMSHKQVVVDVAATGKSMRVIVSGKANKAKMGFKVQLERLSEQLNSLASEGSRMSSRISNQKDLSSR